VEVIDTKNGSSYLFVCGQWLSRDAAGHNKGLDGSSMANNDGVQLERVDGSDTDVRVSFFLHHARVQSTDSVLYRLQFWVGIDALIYILFFFICPLTHCLGFVFGLVTSKEQELWDFSFGFILLQLFWWSLLFLVDFLFYQDANVYLSLKGALWDVESIELAECLNHTDKFERGSEDIFEFRFPPLGEILSLKIMHDNSGLTNPVR
jgi:hypothetical protein